MSTCFGLCVYLSDKAPLLNQDGLFRYDFPPDVLHLQSIADPGWKDVDVLRLLLRGEKTNNFLNQNRCNGGNMELRHDSFTAASKDFEL